MLFNTGRPEGAAFRDAVLAWRTPADQAAGARAAGSRGRRLVADRARLGEDRHRRPDDAGAFFQLYTEVRLEAGDAMPSMYVEIA